MKGQLITILDTVNTDNPRSGLKRPLDRDDVWDSNREDRLRRRISVDERQGRSTSSKYKRGHTEVPLIVNGTGTLQPQPTAGTSKLTKKEREELAWQKYRNTPVERPFPNCVDKDYGMELYNTIVAEGHDDPLQEWLHCLGLPCHPSRLQKESKKTESSRTGGSVASVASSFLGPPTSLMSSSTSMSKGSQKSKGSSVSYYSAR